MPTYMIMDIQWPIFVYTAVVTYAKVANVILESDSPNKAMSLVLELPIVPVLVYISVCVLHWILWYAGFTELTQTNVCAISAILSSMHQTQSKK